MYMANARNLRLVPNTTYIPLTCVGGFALGDVNNLRNLTQKYQHVGIFALGDAKVLSFALADAKVPNVNGFASQWNIGFTFFSLPQNNGYQHKGPEFRRSLS